MSLTEIFNQDYRTSKCNDFVLTVDYSAYSTVILIYDFAARLLISRTGGAGGQMVTPFSQLDREVLEAHRDKLIELGGKPPELPSRTTADMGKVAKLELG